jgi:hypothetical protein
MIVSYLHNFIFIKTKKTAGSSMEVALATHAGPDDIVTPMGQKEEVERIKLYPSAYPRNFSTDKAAEQRYLEALKTEKLRAIKIALRAANQASDVRTQRHDRAEHILEATGKEFWRKAYKFTIERHPYEKAVSLAWFERGRRQKFEDALDSVLRKNRYRNYDHYTLDGVVAVDFIIRYEHMNEDLQKVEERLGLPIVERLPRSNSRQRKDRSPAREVLTDSQKRIVQDTCREEFELMGYER